MNNSELQAIRKLLMLDVREAAEEIGKVSVRTWQYWESGRSKVPVDIEVEMNTLLEVRLERMRAIDDQLSALPEGQKLRLPYCLSFEQYLTANLGSTKTLWRMDQGIAALYYTEGVAELY
ncbi:DUF1870 family protein [Azorhizophilus paspali]|uniref:DUF1870 family protein n=1 Tax=Azorhizophilus paspali TaxID=69963 RepID=A0ABV6SH05_AZOPA